MGIPPRIDLALKLHLQMLVDQSSFLIHLFDRISLHHIPLINRRLPGNFSFFLPVGNADFRGREILKIVGGWAILHVAHMAPGCLRNALHVRRIVGVIVKRVLR